MSLTPPTIDPRTSADFKGAIKLLDDSRLDALDLVSPVAPANAAFDPVTQSWRLTVRTTRGQVIFGVALLGFAAIWLWLSDATRVVSDFPGLSAGADSLHRWGTWLFRLPFTLAGGVVAMAGVACIMLRQTAYVSAQLIRSEFSVANLMIRRQTLRPTDVLALRAFVVAHADGNQCLGLVAKQGVMLLPIMIRPGDKGESEVRQHARWLVGVLKRPDLQLDPNPPDSFRELEPDATSMNLRSLIHRAQWVIIACALGGVALFIAAIAHSGQI